MKRIKYIAKNELYSLFYSPIAWLLMILFLILTSTDYIGVMDAYLRGFMRGGPDLRGIHELTNLFISDRFFGYFPKIITNLYMIFPLITMGLISREVNNGTIKLLYSSPVSVTEVVLGKYFAITIFSLTLISLTGVTLMFFPVTIVHPVASQMISALFGLFLVMSCYAAIGLFVSSLTAYQAVAAIATLVLFGLLNIIDGFLNNVDFIRDITYYLNFQNKSANFIKGFLNSRDFIYFLLIITAFLCFTIIRIDNQRLSISKAQKFCRYGVVIVSAWLIGFITSLPRLTFYFDSTRDGLYTISKPTQKTLRKLNDGELKITAYANLMQGGYKFYPSEQNKVKSNVWEPYVRFKPDIHIAFKYYYNHPDSSWIQAFPGKSLTVIAKEMAKSEKQPFRIFMSPEEVSKEVDIEKEENRNFFVLEYKGRKTILRTFNDPIFWPDENQISAALNRLVGIPPKIYFLTGELERGPYSLTDRNYESFVSERGARFSLINEGYDVDTISLTKHEMPTDGVALVIADPRVAFNSIVVQKINAYIASGGNIMVLAERDREEILAPILGTLGVSFRKGMLIQPSDKYSSDDIFPYLSSTAATLSPEFSRELKWQVIYYGDSLHKVRLPGAAALTYEKKNGFTVFPLLFTDSTLSWNRTAPLDKDSLQTKVSSLPSDEHGSFPTSILLHRRVRGRDQRIIITSDADYFTNPFVFGHDGLLVYNGDFAFWNFGYFSYGRFPPNTLKPEDIDNAYKIGLKGRDVQKVILYYILPGLVGLLGSIILIRRKRK